jgi:hypothetical protein
MLLFCRHVFRGENLMNSCSCRFDALPHAGFPVSKHVRGASVITGVRSS